ncbi:hypothetical protein VARIO8X_60209 [Burkholderiales bacterium 8X]|nr:hypothetical protein VARIO8X_60209 [Burkholderiales bacterium 8X]
MLDSDDEMIGKKRPGLLVGLGPGLATAVLTRLKCLASKHADSPLQLHVQGDGIGPLDLQQIGESLDHLEDGAPALFVVADDQAVFSQLSITGESPRPYDLAATLMATLARTVYLSVQDVSAMRDTLLSLSIQRKLEVVVFGPQEPLNGVALTGEVDTVVRLYAELAKSERGATPDEALQMLLVQSAGDVAWLRFDGTGARPLVSFSPTPTDLDRISAECRLEDLTLRQLPLKLLSDIGLGYYALVVYRARLLRNWVKADQLPRVGALVRAMLATDQSVSIDRNTMAFIRLHCADMPKIMDAIPPESDPRPAHASLLHQAVALSNVELIEKLVIVGGMDIDEPLGLLGESPLQRAVLDGDDLVFRKLFKLGANVNYRDHALRTLLHTAIEAGDDEMVELLFGPKMAHFQHRETVWPFGGITPLMMACDRGWKDGVELLLQLGADPKRIDDSGRNALQRCEDLAEPDPEIVAVLRQALSGPRPVSPQ